jgi:hypothetical protein
MVLIERTVHTSRENDWRAAAWRLERRDPRKWGRRDYSELSGPNGQPIKTQTSEAEPKIIVYIPENGRDK